MHKPESLQKNKTDKILWILYKKLPLYAVYITVTQVVIY